MRSDQRMDSKFGSRPTPEFTSPSSMGERTWGEEILLIHAVGNYTLKKLITNAGKCGNLQYHRFKDESNYIISGELLLRYVDNDNSIKERIVKAGEHFRLPPGCIHQEIAITEVVRIEVSNPVFNDRVRMEKEYGLPEINGLPTTSPDEVEWK